MIYNFCCSKGTHSLLQPGCKQKSPHTTLAAKCLILSQILIILGAKGAEDYQERVMYQWVSGQC